MTELSVRDSKLIQNLNEAYGKEKELETALQAHIGMTTRPPYKKRLQQHLTETKRHARELERRIKRIGGSTQLLPVDAPAPVAKGADVAVELGNRALAAAKGPLHAIRGTGEQEKMLKNAKSQFADEHEEIATYTAIETLAEAVSDRETAKLARAIRREEESMARFLERLIPTLTKAVMQAEIPAAERRSGTSRRSSGRTSTRRTTARRSGGSTAGASRSGRRGAAQSRSARSSSGSRGRSPGSTRQQRARAS
jgi:ferritin-like metal-binding protein YciE